MRALRHSSQAAWRLGGFGDMVERGLLRGDG